MQEALNGQINAELWSAYLYLSMSLDADAEGYPGIAKWFWVQWLEEQDHARILQKYVIDCGAKVVLKPLLNVRTTWKSPLEMFNDALSHEMDVTRMIHGLYAAAISENDYATQERLLWFISEQVEEESNARAICDLLRAACRQNASCGEHPVKGDDGSCSTAGKLAFSEFNCHLVDKELGMRCYKKASPLE